MPINGRVSTYELDSAIQNNYLGATNYLEKTDEKNGNTIFLKAQNPVNGKTIYTTDLVMRSNLANFIKSLNKSYIHDKNTALIIPIADDKNKQFGVLARRHYMTLLVHNGNIRLIDSKRPLPGYIDPLKSKIEQAALKQIGLKRLHKISYKNQSLPDTKSCGWYTALTIQKIIDGKLSIDKLMRPHAQVGKADCKQELTKANFGKLFTMDMLQTKPEPTQSNIRKEEVEVNRSSSISSESDDDFANDFDFVEVKHDGDKKRQLLPDIASQQKSKPQHQSSKSSKLKFAGTLLAGGLVWGAGLVLSGVAGGPPGLAGYLLITGAGVGFGIAGGVGASKIKDFKDRFFGEAKTQENNLDNVGRLKPR